MKRTINFNKLIVLLVCIVGSTIVLSSCLKARDGSTSFDNLQATLSIPEGGLAQFSSQSLVYPASDVSDTTTFTVDYASVNVAPVDEVVTLTIDNAAVAAYNSANGLAGSAAFQLMPDSLFSYSTTQVTIKAGQTYSSAIQFVIFPYKIDPTVSYMLPIKITGGANGALISQNYGEIYYHVIGNPIAGTYEQYWSRWNHADSSSGSAGALYYNFDVGPVTFAPNSPTEIAVGSQGTGETDIIDFTNTAGVLSNFTVSFPAGEAATLGLKSMGTPQLLKADPVNGIYVVYFGYVNGGGSPRVIVNTYIKQ